MQELTAEEMQNINGGSLSAAAVAAGLCGFGVGAVIGFAVIGGLIYAADRF